MESNESNDTDMKKSENIFKKEVDELSDFIKSSYPFLYKIRKFFRKIINRKNT